MQRRWDRSGRAARPCIRPFRRSSHAPLRGLIGARTECIRERGAPSSAPSNLCKQGPGFRKDPGLLSFQTPTGLRIGAGPRSTDRSAACGDRSLTSCRKTAPVLADGSSCTFADVAQQVEQGHAMAKTWVRDPSFAPLRVCPCTPWPRLNGVGGPGCARSLARPRAARHHVRRDARVRAQPKWIQSKPS